MSKLLYPAPVCNTPQLVEVMFAFVINGTSDPVLIRPVNTAVTDIVASGTGTIYTCTLDEKFPVFLGLTGNVMGPSGGSAVNDVQVKCAVSDYSSTAGTLALTLVDAHTTAAAVNPTTGSVVFVRAVFCRRTDLCPQGAI